MTFNRDLQHKAGLRCAQIKPGWSPTGTTGQCGGPEVWGHSEVTRWPRTDSTC